MAATSYRYLTNIPGVRSGRTIIEGTRIGDVADVARVLRARGHEVVELREVLPTRRCGRMPLRNP